MIRFRPGEQLRTFEIYRKSTNINDKGRYSYSEKEKLIGKVKGSISQASQKEVDRWKQQGYPINHTIVVYRDTTAQAGDILVLNKNRKFYVQGKDSPGELGIYNVLYCDERSGV